MGFKLKSNDLVLAANSRAYHPQFSTNFGTFFLLNHTMVIFCSLTSKYTTTTLFIDRQFWLKFALMQYISTPYNLTYLVDAIQFKVHATALSVQVNYNSMLTDYRTHCYTTVNLLSFSLLSLTGVFASNVWLERELSEFSGLYFQGLNDSRRLLLDYFQEKKFWKTHITNDKSYSNEVYEVIYNF